MSLTLILVVEDTYMLKSKKYREVHINLQCLFYSSDHSGKWGSETLEMVSV